LATPPDAVRDDVRAMSEERRSEVLSGLPRTRPHRRSDKRARPQAPVAPANDSAPAPAGSPSPGPQAAAKPRAKVSAGAAAKPRAKASAGRKPAAARPATGTRTSAAKTSRPRPPAAPPPEPAGSQHLLGTAAQAAAELAEIGVSVGTRSLRRVLSRLPRI